MEMGMEVEQEGIDSKSCKPECPRMCGPASTVKSEKAAHNIRSS